ncbi:MAG TPA: type IV pili methyl-accepting chemotaxis transducer N-terminal domain-containing protein [Saprospiraceae bacterium]|nr:type IV pili methyl-accepting chemotaxis transducer N-terminal domain-containing protein [Saprospiraceae bacterium]
MVDNFTAGIPQSELSKSALSKLKLYYVIAVSIILFTIVLSQLFIFNHLQKQIKDSRVINIAGRQRMLSQKITKEIFKLNFSTNTDAEKSRLKSEILKNLTTWNDSHSALKNRSSKFEIEGQNSAEINQQFKEIQPIFDNLYKAALLSLDTVNHQDLDQIYALSDEFLKKMDDIVFTYDKDASNRVTTLKKYYS